MSRQIPRPLLLAGLLSALVPAMLTGAPVAAQETSQSASEASLDSLLNLPISAASKYLQDTREAAASTTVLSSEDIARFGYRTLFDALVTVRGFYGSSDRNYSYLGARGFSRPTDYNNRLLLLLDGHLLNENMYSAAAFDLELGVAIEDVERIEIVRGPASAIFGGNAVLGVVNIVTKSASNRDHAELGADAASFGYYRGRVSVSDVFDGGEVILRAHWFDARGSDLYSEAFDSEATNNGVSTGLDWENGYGFMGTVRRGPLTLDLSGSSRAKGIPTAPWEIVFNDERARTEDRRLSADLQYQARLDDRAELTLVGSYDSYGYDGQYPYEVGDGGLYEDQTHGRRFGTRADLVWDPSPRSRLLLGVEANRNQKARFDSWDEDSGYLFGYDRPFTVLSVYAQNEISLSARSSLVLGARVDDYSDLGTSVSPRAAFLYHPAPSTTLKLLFGEAFRPPSRWEGFYEEEGFHERNPNLAPETIGTIELVAEHRLADGILATASLFQYRMRDLIDETWDPVDEVTSFENVSSVDARGLEIGLRGHLAEGVGGYANFVVQRVRDGDDSVLSNSPKSLFRAGLYAPVLPFVTVGGELIYDGERATLWETTTDSYSLVNLNLSTDEVFGRARISFAVRNAFDTSYETPAGWEHAQTGIPQEGRAFRLTTTIRF